MIHVDDGPVATLSMSAISLDEEVRLYTTNAERERYNTLATLYGIIIALDYLERAYVRDSITAAEWVSFHIRMRQTLSRYFLFQEVFSCLYTPSISVQDHVEACWA